MSLHEFPIDVKQWSREWVNRAKTDEEKEAEQRAVELAWFSRTNGQIVPGSRKNLLVFKQPAPGTNLNGDDHEKFLDQQNSSKVWRFLDPHLQCGIDVQQYDIVTGRNTLVNLGSALYEGRKSFQLSVVTLGAGRTVFMSFNCQEESEERGMQHYWAARFEALCTKRNTVNRGECFYSLLKRKIGRHQVLFCTEIDCRLKSKAKSKQPPLNYVELKCRQHVPENNYIRFMFRYLKYWLQSHLADVPTIVEGVRDDQGKLVRVERFETEELPEICKQHREALGMGWNPKKVLDFLEFVLNKIVHVCERNAGVTVRVKFDAKKKMITAKSLPNDQFVQLVRNILSPTKSKQKQSEGMLLKSEDTSEKMEQVRAMERPSRAPRHDETDQIVEEATSQPKPSQDFFEFAWNEISDIFERNASLTVRVKFDAKEKVITAKLLPEDEFVKLMQNALANSKSEPKQPEDILVKSENTSMNAVHARLMEKSERAPDVNESDSFVQERPLDSRPSQITKKNTVGTRISNLYNRILHRLYSLVGDTRWLLEHWARLKRAVVNRMPARQ